MKAKHQARKGWKRVDKEWFGMQAKSSNAKKATTRTPANSGEFVCTEFPRSFIAEEVSKWANETCNPDKNFSIAMKKSIGIMMCCINKE